MGARRRSTLAAMVAGGLLAAAMAGSVVAADGSVSIANFAFSPGTVTIQEGDSVTWTNNDSTPHTATGNGFDTEAISPGQSSTVPFATAGNYTYVCSIHPQMSGTVVVEAAATAPPTEAPTDAPTAAPTSGGGGGGGDTTTQPPTDMPEPTDDASSTPTTAIALLLAISGIAMLVGTYLFERRAARR